MYRMTRWEYLKSLIGLGASRPKRERRRSGEKSKRWAWSLDGRGGIVNGHTRSHARAEIKRELGIKKSRLPIGAAINCLGI
jgi:hypothetical protein